MKTEKEIRDFIEILVRYQQSKGKIVDCAYEEGVKDALLWTVATGNYSLTGILSDLLLFSLSLRNENET